ncbi:hypothetical protein Tco_0344317 [Tanacetum coccineum]
MTTLAKHIIVVGAENRPPMLEESMYDSWASHIHLFIKGKKHGRMMLDSIDNDNCDVQATNIILHGLPPDVYALGETLYEYYWRFSQLINDMHTIWDDNAASSMTLQSQAKFPQLDSDLAVPTFQQGDDPIECINKTMAFLSAVASRNRGIATTSRGKYAAGQVKVVKCYNYLGEGHMAKQCTQPKRPQSSAWFKKKLMLVEVQEAGQILDEEQLAFIADHGIAEVQVAQQTIPRNLAF